MESDVTSTSELRAARAFGMVTADAARRVGNPFGTLLALGGGGGGGFGGVGGVGVPGGVLAGLGGAFGRVPLGAVSEASGRGAGAAPVYVNAKQYHAIVRRRKQRAKLAEKQREAGMSGGDVRSKYESRVAHAKNRVRGPNGQYLTREELLAGAGGPEARARALAREEEIKELARKREAKKLEREAKRRAKLAAQRRSKGTPTTAATRSEA